VLYIFFFLDCDNSSNQYYGPSIPKIIHQSWKRTLNETSMEYVEKGFFSLQKSWKRNHPNWIYMFWTDFDNRKLVLDHFPHLLEFYDKLPANIIRADFSRILYMYHYGGVYADLDTESIKPLDPFLENKRIVLGKMDNFFHRDHSIPNAFMASAPNDPFWLVFLSNVVAYYPVNFQSVESFAGPVALWKAYNDYKGKSTKWKEIRVEDPKYLFPLSWNVKAEEHAQACQFTPNEQQRQKCIAFFPDAYVVTYWTHSWFAEEAVLQKAKG